jgi:hypothetical protein
MLTVAAHQLLQQQHFCWGLTQATPKTSACGFHAHPLRLIGHDWPLRSSQWNGPIPCASVALLE